MQEIKKVSVSSSELNPDIRVNSFEDDFLECDFVEFPSGSGEFVPIDHYLEVLFDECDRKEVCHG